MTLEEALGGALVGLFLFSIAAWIFWKRGFFAPPPQERFSLVSGFSLLSIFCLYFGLMLLFYPLAAGLVSERARAALSLLMPLAATLAAVAFTWSSEKLRFSIWNPRSKRGAELAVDFLRGVLSWFFAYPLIYFIASASALLLIWITGEFPSDLEQSPIRYIRSLPIDSGLFWLAMFLVAGAIPLAEELLFRGYLQSWLLGKLGAFWSILITSLIFAAIHFTEEQAELNLQILPSLFALSLLLGFLYEQRQSLWAPIGLHAAFNTASLLFLFFPVENKAGL